MGTAFNVPIKSVSSWNECLEFLNVCGVSNNRIFAATMEGSTNSQSIAHYDIDWKSSGPTAVCLGREGTGLSVKVRDAVSSGQIRSVHVPMADGVESLNVGVAGSVIMFENFRQCT
jgi:TrmH family RNA methyltransferase